MPRTPLQNLVPIEALLSGGAQHRHFTL